MNEIRELIYRFRRKEGNRAIARDLKISKNTVKKYRRMAAQQGFLDPSRPLPSLDELNRVMIPRLRPQQMRSTVEPFEEIVRKLLKQEVEMQTIWQRLREDHGYRGSYTSV